MCTVLSTVLITILFDNIFSCTMLSNKQKVPQIKPSHKKTQQTQAGEGKLLLYQASGNYFNSQKLCRKCSTPNG